MEDLSRLARFEEASIVNNDLEDIYKVLEKELKIEEKPQSIIGRFVVDSFGLLVLYVLLFTLCDFTRAALTGGDFFGFKWIVFGPYYFFTKAPLMTRVWKSKKFLEDLANYDDTQTEWPNKRTCTSIGNSYTTGCNNDKSTPGGGPVRNHLGKGLDWTLRHIFGGGTIGKFLNNTTCEEQGTTISRMCASDRVQAAYDCYTFFCGAHGIERVADINDPNMPNGFNGQTNNWDGLSKEAYRKYYEVYTAVYDIGSVLMGNDHVPKNLNPTYDDFNNYCYNAGALFSSHTVGVPPWWLAENGPSEGPCFYQHNYEAHSLDYWDPVTN